MPTPSQANRLYVKRLCFDALLVCAALLLSYLETLLPISLVVPLPGVRLGLANIAVMLAFFAISPTDAAGISLVRISLSALLFGSTISFFFSLCGAVLSYIGILLFGILLRKQKLSFIGLSAGCAVLHVVGQIAAAMIIYTPAAFSYLPMLIFTGSLTGALCGFILNLVFEKVKVIINVN